MSNSQNLFYDAIKNIENKVLHEKIKIGTEAGKDSQDNYGNNKLDIC